MLPTRTRRIGAALIVLLSGCRDPTEVTVVLRTEACSALDGVTVTVGERANLDSKPIATSTDTCSSETRIGSLVLVPSNDDRASFSLKVVAGAGVDPENCPSSAMANDGEGCIVAKRSLGFIPNEVLELPIDLRRACLGVLCGDEQTCVQGECVTSVVQNPSRCVVPDACDESSLLSACPYPGVVEDCYTGPSGTMDVGACRHGKRTCQGDFTWTSCAGEIRPTTENCATIADEDCSGPRTDCGDFLSAASLQPSNVINDVVIDTAGLPIVAGNYSGSFPGVGDPMGLSSAFVARLDSQGGVLHGTNFASSSVSVVQLAVDDAKDVFVLGYSGVTTTIAGNSITPGWFLVKLDAKDEVRYAISLVGWFPTGGSFAGMDADTAGNIWLAGIFVQSLTAGSVSLSAPGNDGCLVKIDAEGKPILARQFNVAGTGSAAAVAVDPTTSDVYVAGQFDGTVNLGDQVLASKAPFNVVIAKYDAKGTLAFSEAVSSPTSVVVEGLTADASGPVLFARFADVVDLGKDQNVHKTSAGSATLIAGYSPSGAVRWSRVLPQLSITRTRSRAPYIAATGSVSLPRIDFGQGSIHVPSTSSFDLILDDTTGSTVWGRFAAVTAASSPSLATFAVALDQHFVYTGGSFSGVLAGGLDATKEGQVRGFLIKQAL